MSEAEIIEDLAAFLEQLVADDKFSGAVLVAKNATPLFKQVYGLASKVYNVPNRIDTKFNLASMNGNLQDMAFARYTEIQTLLTLNQEQLVYRLLAIDLDGTLLTPQPYKNITPRTRQTLFRATEAGIIVVIATGQNLAVLRHVCGDLPLQGPQIIENGAVIADLQGTIYHEKPFPGEFALPVLDTLHRYGFYRAYHTIHRVYVDKDTPRARTWYRPPVPPAIEVDDVANLYPLPCVKIVGIGEEREIRGKRSEFESLFEGKLYVTQSSFDLVEFLHPAVSKGNALKVIAADLNIRPEEIVAFGDNHNDIGMLQFAGLGIAMGNAHEEVKSMADYVTSSNAEDGVAKAIEELVLPAIS